MPHYSPMRAIRGKCLDCSGGSTKEVELCKAMDCPLWCFRLGRNPPRDPQSVQVRITLSKLTMDELADARYTKDFLSASGLSVVERNERDRDIIVGREVGPEDEPPTAILGGHPHE